MRERLFAPAVFEDRRTETGLLAGYVPVLGKIFVDVGAHHPLLNSQTLELERRGWTGLLVEPLAEMAELLRKLRAARVAEVACGSPEQHGRTLPFKVLDSGSTLAADFTAPGLVATEVRQVPVVTLDSLLVEARIERVDFVSIDVEGTELDVLRGFSIERYRPQILLIEDNNALNRRLHRHMVGHGYKLVRRTNVNSWYVPREVVFPISLFGRWQLLRKYFLGVPFRVIRKKIRQT